MIVHQLDRDIAVAQQLDVVIELARRDGAGARLFNFGLAGGLDALVEIGRGDGQLAFVAIRRSLKQEVREDGDGRFTLDDGLGRGQLPQQFGAADADLHGKALSGVLVCFKSYGWHVLGSFKADRD